MAYREFSQCSSSLNYCAGSTKPGEDFAVTQYGKEKDTSCRGSAEAQLTTGAGDVKSFGTGRREDELEVFLRGQLWGLGPEQA